MTSGGRDFFGMTSSFLVEGRAFHDNLQRSLLPREETNSRACLGNSPGGRDFLAC